MRRRHRSANFFRKLRTLAAAIHGLALTCTAAQAAGLGHAGHAASGDASMLPGDLLLFPDLTGIVRYDQEQIGRAHV